MTEPQVTVWVDRDALELETRVGREMEVRAQPEADAAIRHLIDADCRVILWGRPDGTSHASPTSSRPRRCPTTRAAGS